MRYETGLETQVYNGRTFNVGTNVKTPYFSDSNELDAIGVIKGFATSFSAWVRFRKNAYSPARLALVNLGRLEIV